MREPRGRPPGPTLREVAAGVAAELELAGIESAHVEAERLISAALGIARSRLVVDGGEHVDPAGAASVARAVARRLDGEPLQHIEGTVDFRRLVLVSDGRALIPRPETEQLLDLIVAHVRVADPVARALEVGVGSGAIALSLLTEDLVDFVVGLDVSAPALAQARENAARTGVESRLDLRLCPAEIWPPVAGEPRFDLLVANLPYIASGDIAGLPPEVGEHEPRVSLDGGEDGLAVIRTLIAGAPPVLAPGASLFLEIGAGQGVAVMSLLAERAGWEAARVVSDLAGSPRFVTARRMGSGPGPN